MSKDEHFQILGQAIRAQRQRLGSSQQEIADLASVSVNLLRQIEAGKASAQISKVLDVMTAVGLQFRLAAGHAGIEIPAGLQR